MPRSSPDKVLSTKGWDIRALHGKGNNEHTSSCGKWSLMNSLFNLCGSSLTARHTTFNRDQVGFDSHLPHQKPAGVARAQIDGFTDESGSLRYINKYGPRG